MLFGRKNKKPNDRILDLKARVDALRAADEAHRQKPASLDDFLTGDDVLTGRAAEDDYQPSGFDAQAPAEDQPRSQPSQRDEAAFEVNLQAELEKYIRREEERAKSDAPASPPPSKPASTWPADSGWATGNDAGSSLSKDTWASADWPSRADSGQGDKKAGGWDDWSKDTVSDWPSDEKAS